MATVIVIDDEPPVRDLLRAILEDAEYAVADFPHGRGAIQYLRRQPAELLITDIFMPEMEGLETIRQARILRPEMPVLAVSGRSLEGNDYLYAAAQLGAFATLKKPFSRGDLLAVIDD